MTLSWADATGTTGFSGYSRDHCASLSGKCEPLPMSAPPWFRGDKSRYSPGELLLAALSSNHMTSFLEIASEMGLVVVSYVDDADACARLGARGDGYMAEVTLRPVVTVLPGPHATETSVAWIHERAAEMSVVCKSVALAVTIEPGPLAILEEAVSA